MVKNEKLIKTALPGYVNDARTGSSGSQVFSVVMTSESRGKFMAISNGDVHFTMPLEPIIKALNELLER